MRQATQQPVIVIDRGTRIALLKPYSEQEIVGQPVPVPFPVRDPASMPAVGVDSTELISRDRSQRMLDAADSLRLEGRDIPA